MRWLAFAALAACGAKPVEETKEDPSRDVTLALADAAKLIRSRHLDAAEQRLAAERAQAAHDPHLLEKLDYYIATVMVYRGDVGGAQSLLEAHATSAASRGDYDSQAWMESSITWLRWSAGDLPGAIAANERLAKIAENDDIDASDRRAWQLSQLRDRAFLLLESSLALPAADRSDALAKAREARDEHENFSRGDDNQAPVHALAAWFAWRLGDLPAAQRAITAVNVVDDSDARDLFIVALVADATGERERAERARARLGRVVNILVPLLLRFKPPPPA